jgi:hypothetical protein
LNRPLYFPLKRADREVETAAESARAPFPSADESTGDTGTERTT